MRGIEKEGGDKTVVTEGFRERVKEWEWDMDVDGHKWDRATIDNITKLLRPKIDKKDGEEEGVVVVER